MSSHIRSNLGYLAALAVASGLILFLGVVLRPRHAPIPTISEAERVQLQNMAQRQALQRRSVVLAGYAREVSPEAARVLQQPDAASYSEPQPGEMLIIVAVIESGEPRWITTEFAGYGSIDCGDRTITEINVDAVIPSSLARAAVFTLEENVVGLVARCGSRLIVVDAKNYAALRQLDAEQSYMTSCGVRFARESDDQPGRAVRELRVGSVLDRAGVEVGDRILTINGEEITTNDALRNLIGAPVVVVEVERAGRKLTLRHKNESPVSGVSLQRSNVGLRVIDVEPGSAAERLGLQPGDVVVRAGAARRPSPAILEKLLATETGAAIAVIRDNREILLEAAHDE